MLYYQLKTRIKADYTGLETPYLDKMSRLSGAQFNKCYGVCGSQCWGIKVFKSCHLFVEALPAIWHFLAQSEAWKYIPWMTLAQK